jgi:hypothetical protein
LRQTRRAAFLAVALGAFATPGQRPSADEPYPLRIEVGESVAICYLGELVCPAVDPICDDPSIATAGGDENNGLLFKGVKPGVTLCSVASGAGLGHRRLFRVTVIP